MLDNSERIIGVTGTPGSGKSTLALNLALAWAGSRPRDSLIVEFPSRRRRKRPGSIDSAALLRLWPAVIGRPPHVSVSRYGVGVLRLGRMVRAAGGADPRAIRAALTRLAAEYDVFLDIDHESEHMPLALSLCRRSFWVTLPRRTHLRALAWADAFPSQVDRGRVDVVVNRAWERGSRAVDDIAQSLALLGWRAPIAMPHDPSVPAWAENGRLLIEERPWSPWIAALRRPLGVLSAAFERDSSPAAAAAHPPAAQGLLDAGFAAG